ncbi:hypothetical protein HDU76_010781 [Blyttiomyces sp. JEL0837]|nr:hypothetical protein HDU76_010781 [Blyttiomyces sp. JEL0837]
MYYRMPSNAKGKFRYGLNNALSRCRNSGDDLMALKSIFPTQFKPPRGQKAKFKVLAGTFESNPNMNDFAVDVNDVFQFVRAVVRRVIPIEFWGTENNQHALLYGTAMIVAQAKLNKLGYSNLRLLPKERGIRPIANLRHTFAFREQKPRLTEVNAVVKLANNTKTSVKAQSNGKTKYKAAQHSINSKLNNTFQALTYEKNRQQYISSAVSGLSEIYVKWKNFCGRIRELKPEGKLYFVKVDVTQCFDNIDQSIVLRILESIMQEDEYFFQKYDQIHPAGGSFNIKYMKRTLLADESLLFSEFSRAQSKSSRNAIFVDKVKHHPEEAVALLSLVKEHLQNNVIKYGGNFYRQTKGIPQGSVLSTLLCSLYYDDMELQNLQEYFTPTSLLLRLVDDFLFVTPERDLADKFLRTMLQGFPNYGCFVNPSKSICNFRPTAYSDDVKSTNEGLQVQVDYSRFENAYVNVIKSAISYANLRIKQKINSTVKKDKSLSRHVQPIEIEW